jgi:hypothetical protein
MCVTPLALSQWLRDVTPINLGRGRRCDGSAAFSLIIIGICATALNTPRFGRFRGRVQMIVFNLALRAVDGPEFVPKTPTAKQGVANINQRLRCPWPNGLRR